MQISISTRHGRLSDKTKAKLEEKVSKLPRIFERLTAIEMTVDLSDETTPTVDLKVSAEHKHDFVATETSEDLMASVDEVVHKLEQQLRKYKERVQERHRNPAVKEPRVPAEEE